MRRPFVEYGSEYRTVLQDWQVKFVKMRDPNDSVRVPEITRTHGRIYVTLGRMDELKYITKYDGLGKKVLQIDLAHAHTSGGRALCPHSHDEFNHAEGRPLTRGEQRLVDRITKTWRHCNEGK